MNLLHNITQPYNVKIKFYSIETLFIRWKIISVSYQWQWTPLYPSISSIFPYKPKQIIYRKSGKGEEKVKDRKKSGWE